MTLHDGPLAVSVTGSRESISAFRCLLDLRNSSVSLYCVSNNAHRATPPAAILLISVLGSNIFLMALLSVVNVKLFPNKYWLNFFNANLIDALSFST